MDATNGIGELAAALSKAQAAFPKVLKDRTAKIQSPRGNYEYKYADLATLIEAIRKPLADNGLAFSQLIQMGEGHHVLHTVLIHSSGAELCSNYALGNHDRPQEMGSEITYARRYALSALLGVASEDDDDGAAAQRSDSVRAKKPPYEGKDAPFEYRGPRGVQVVPASVLDAQAPVSDAINEADRDFLVGAVRRAADKYKFTTEERMAIQSVFLDNLAPGKADLAKLKKLYLFTGDEQAVKDWRAEQKAASA